MNNPSFFSKQELHDLKILDRILEKGKINKTLYQAVKEIIEAIKQKNIGLISELSSVKSLISGEMKSSDSEYPFKEDNDYNEKHLGESVYSSLGTIHFEYSIKADKIPSGIMLITSNGIEQSDHKSNSDNKMVKKINDEFDRTWKRGKYNE